MALQGAALFSLNYLLFYAAAAHLTSGLMAVAFSTITVMNIANGALFFGTPVERRVLLAAVAGMTGLALVFWPELALFGPSGALGLVLSLLATYLASLGNMLAVRHQRAGVPVVAGNAWGMTYGALIAFAIALGGGAPLAFDGSAGYAVSLLYLALGASVMGFGCYLTLLRRIGAARAAYATVLFPLVALALSTAFEGYRWTAVAAAGVLLVLFGNLLVLARKPAALPARG